MSQKYCQKFNHEYVNIRRNHNCFFCHIKITNDNFVKYYQIINKTQPFMPYIAIYGTLAYDILYSNCVSY